MNKEALPYHPGTRCVHAGTQVDPRTGGVCTPIYNSSAYAHPNPAGENVYPRYFNVPNQRAVAEKLAALEHGEAGLVFSSGMAAISTVLFAHLKPGDHAVFQADLYGGTHHFITEELVKFGIEISFAREPREFTEALRPNTRLLYVESPSNPLLGCVDLATVAQTGRKQRVLKVIDNTFATPINQTPLEFGFDVVIHSGTKFLNGHSDVNCGAVVSSREIIQQVREYAMNHGGTLDAHACWLLERGLKTLALRVRQQNANAEQLASFLQAHSAVAQVHYPGLPNNPQHLIAARQMRGFGGMLSFELKRARQVTQVLKRFRLVTRALSLGGVESLICVPAQTSHVTLSRQERLAAGIGDGLLRVSVGIEDVEDLLADFAQALEIA